MNQIITNETTQSKITMRQKLSLPEDLTFGIEIEYANAYKSKVDRLFSRTSFTSKEDSTVSKTCEHKDTFIICGGEVSSSILKNNPNSWKKVVDSCTVLKSLGAEISDGTSGHIHIGANKLKTAKEWLQMIKLWIIYEDIIYRFSMGENDQLRSSAYDYAQKCGLVLKKHLPYLEDHLDDPLVRFIYRIKADAFLGSRNYGINPYPYKESRTEKILPTIEFRCPNGTLNPAIWQNNINFFSHLVLASKLNLDEEQLDARIASLTEEDFSYEEYHKINEAKALELANIIFDNPLDKTNFLTQYYEKKDNPPKILRKVS